MSLPADADVELQPPLLVDDDFTSAVASPAWDQLLCLVPSQSPTRRLSAQPSARLDFLDYAIEGPEFLGARSTVPGPEDLILEPATSVSPRMASLAITRNLVATRLQYGVDKLKAAPEQMVLENQTPWSHPALYRDTMPRSMQDAHACCALYIAKNNVNAPVIFRSIEARLEELLAAPEPTTPIEHLAHTQALLLYHIMRLLDGDIVAHACAVETMPALDASVSALLRHIVFENPKDPISPTALPLYPLAATREFWDSWVFMESARRTILTVYLFLQLCRLLRGQRSSRCDSTLSQCHSLTLSAHLWHAADAFDFAVAWREKDHFVANCNSLMRVLEEARGDDIETLGKMVMTSVMGIDEAKGWLATRGGTL